MEPRLQRRIQRYGWDLAAAAYEPLWRAQLAPAQAALLERAVLRPGERVLDVACGTGLVSLAAAALVGAQGAVVGTDISGAMIAAARARAAAWLQAAAGPLAPLQFERLDAEHMPLAAGWFDVALCALGLMYVPSPERAVGEMRRLLRPGGRLVLLVWGEPARCAWEPVFRIVDAEVHSEVCPLFFRLSRPGALLRLCSEAGFEPLVQQRFAATLHYADEDAACDAALVGGPVALAWSRFDAAARARVRTAYLQAIEAWRGATGYALAAEFTLVEARVPEGPGLRALAQPRTYSPGASASGG
jgi:ubiquinone/menaquinone biosynthesis C-methylase UbiE